MFKLSVLAMFVCAANAGIIGGGIGLNGGIGLGGIGLGGLGHGVVVSHGASSYQNSNLLALNPTAVVSRVAVATPVISKVAVAAPVAVGVAPIGLGLGYGKGLALGGIGLGGVGLGGYH